MKSITFLIIGITTFLFSCSINRMQESNTGNRIAKVEKTVRRKPIASVVLVEPLSYKFPEDTLNIIRMANEEMLGFPQYIYGEKKIYDFLQNNIVYHPIAEEYGIQMKVTIQFRVNKDGIVDMVQPLKRYEPVLEKEVIRVLQKTEWIPAIRNNEKVNTIVFLSVVFKLIYP